MSVRNKSLIFLALTFAISWGVTLGAHFSGLKDQIGPVVVLVLMMTGPGIAALICALAFESKGARIDALGLRFKPNVWWLYAWLIPLTLAALSVIATVLLGGREFADIGESIISAVERQSPSQAEQMRQVQNLGLIIALVSAFVGSLVNAPILTMTEELGWRGYLHHLWRPYGFWRASLATGAIWGVWHAPAILFYGLNYPEHAELGTGIFVAWCILLAPIMTLIRDRGGATWAAGIAHGTINAVAGLTIAGVSNPEFPWTGLVGIGGFAALVLGVLVVLVLQPKPVAAT